MIRHILRTGLALTAAAALAGCLGDSDSDEYGEDITRYDSNPAAGDSGTYPVQARNGRLERALVWLDMDGDQALSVYDDQDYEDDVLADADDETKARRGVGDSFELTEPWGITDANGNLELDVSALDLPETVAADLDPADYSLMVIAVPGETLNDGEPVGRAFFLSAPPGVSTVSPFTTLAETVRWLRGDSLDAAAAASRLQQEGFLDAQDPISIYQDYLSVRGATRGPYYAGALRRLLQEQVPGERSNSVGQAAGNLDSLSPDEGGITFFSPEDLRVLGSVVLDQASKVISEVDADIEARGLDGYTLPADGQLDSIQGFEPDLANPLVPVEQRYFTPLDNPENEESFAPGALETGSGEDGSVRLGRLTAEDAQLNAQVFFDYGPGGTFSRISVRGQTRPSMGALHFLSDGDDPGDPVGLGYAPYLDMETGQVLSEAVERDGLSPGVLDERFGNGNGAIDWGTPRIGLDSGWFGDHSTETYPDGTLERVYIEPGDGSGLVRRPPGTTGQDVVDAAITVTSGGSGVPQGPVGLPVVRDPLGDAISLELHYGTLEEVAECNPGSTIQHVSHKQPVTVRDTESGTELQITRYGHLRDGEDGAEKIAFRVMAESYPESSGGAGVILREYEYPTDGVEDPGDVEQPDRLLSMRVLALESLDAGPRFCGSGGEAFSVTATPADLQYYIGYEYMRFADYLESIGTRSQ
ncbi:hypothetical protein CK501_11895 [Halovibrio salipaludis]|uniref:Uncharacterized protein n=1 Tax=Halovibrio salipaludis TaxID=2032626 RepID=A0A2A2F580_9GAMM|nr:hypothetical protein [Halovibrio salipaludis]PAU79894.1 hypothetical protein CK501_11895 [Halovibrio salipaludis]